MSENSVSFFPQPEEEEIADIQEDIELNEGLLASLEGDSDTESEDSRAVIKRTLKGLRKRLRVLTQPKYPMANDQVDGPSEGPGNDKQDPSADKSTTQNSHLFRPPTSYDLPSRKRQRGDFDDDVESRGSKSRKQSPNQSSAASPAESSDSYDFDDNPFLSRLGHSKEEALEQRRYLKELEDRRKQEEEDAEIARRMQAEIDAAEVASPNQSSISKPPTLKVPGTALWQQTLRSDGSFSQAQSQSSSRANQSEKTSGLSRSREAAGVGSPVSSGAATPGSSQDSLHEIPASQYIPRVPNLSVSGSQPVQQSVPSIPGAFPGYGQYVSTAGSSVYDNIVNYVGTGSYDMNGTDLTNGRVNPITGLPETNADVLRRLNPYLDQGADPAKTQEEIKDLLQHIRPDEEFSDEQLDNIPKGLSKPLMSHQISGLMWMKSMEDGTNKGGILADDMGLGKTLQAIALMLAHPPPADERRPTLVVAPVALMQQWERELGKFVKGGHRLSVHILHGPGRAESYNRIRGFDVVLTTYGTLASELKRRLVYEEKVKTVADASTVRDNCAVLSTRSKFHRVILDEAHNIKNRNTKTAIAACRISADYRWCLTGTPIQNNIEEMYSLVKFCRIKPYNGWDKFSRDFVRPLKGRSEAGKERAMEQLQALLKAILLRRTKKSKIKGQPIIQLPDKHTVEDRAVFDKDQLDFYKALENQAQIQFNRYVRNGSIGRNYGHALVLLLRLRQACCHPALVTNSKDFSQVVGELAVTDMVENAKQLTNDVVKRLKEEEGDSGLECPVCMDASENPTIFPCGHNVCNDCFAKLCDNAINNEEGAQATCPHCRAKINAAKVTNWESFCRVYLPDREGIEPLPHASEDDGSDIDSSSDDEQEDSDDGDDLRDFIVADDEEIEYDNEGSSKPKNAGIKRRHKSKRKTKGKGKKKDDGVSLAQLRKQGLKSKSAKRKYLKRLSKDFVTSTKIEKTLALLEEIRDRGENEKTIIFSSFTSFLDLLEVPLSRHPDFGVYSRYDGSMTAAARNDAVMEFTDKPQNKVILVSLKAGNAGLNLTAANHCIILDPFWNPFIEYQAADRCYRIGQDKEVFVHRVLIGPEEGNEGREDMFTVEDRILKLQETKKSLVESALDERAGERIGRLGVRELGYLFGVNNLSGGRT